MDTLIQDTLDFLREAAKTTPSVFASAEEMAYFAPLLESRPHHSQKENAPSDGPREKKREEIPRPQPTKPAPVPDLLKPEPPAPQKTIPSAEKKILNDMRPLIQKTFPDLSLRETTPDDALARKMSRLWEETYLSAQVVVIAFGEIGPGMEFLKQVVQAIDQLLAPAQLIEGSTLEKERSWDLLLGPPSLKTIICSPWSSWKSTSLAKYYRQNGATQEQFLGEHRLLLLEPSLHYLKHPDRKRKLWHLLSTQLSS